MACRSVIWAAVFAEAIQQDEIVHTPKAQNADRNLLSLMAFGRSLVSFPCPRIIWLQYDVNQHFSQPSARLPASEFFEIPVVI